METPPPPKNFNKNLRYLPCRFSTRVHLGQYAYMLHNYPGFPCVQSLRESLFFMLQRHSEKLSPKLFFFNIFLYLCVFVYLLFFLASTVDIQLFSNKSIKRIRMYTYRICCRQIIVKYEQNTHLRCRQIIANVTFKDILCSGWPLSVIALCRQQFDYYNQTITLTKNNFSIEQAKYCLTLIILFN